MTVSGGRRGGCDEDQDLVGGAIGRDIVGCWRSLLAPQREGATGCSANLRPIGEKRARRGHNPGTIGSNTTSVGAHAATSTDGGSSTVRAGNNTSAGAPTDACAAGPGPTACATDSITSGADGSNTASAGAHTDASAAGRGPATRATANSTRGVDGSATIIPVTDTNAG
jgi:hypothetical protein